MEAIKGIVESVLQGWEKEKAVPTGPDGFLKKVLTKKELEHIKVNYFKKGVLSIKVDSSAWLYHLTLQKGRIIARLTAESADIKDIRFSMGEIK